MVFIHSPFYIPVMYYPKTARLHQPLYQVMYRLVQFALLPAMMIQSKYKADSRQKWKLHYVNSRRYTITNAATNHFLSVGNSKSSGSYAYTASVAENSGQVWNLTPTTQSELKINNFKSVKNIWFRKCYALHGTVQSNYNLQSVTAQFTNSKGKTIVSATAKPHTKKYSHCKTWF